MQSISSTEADNTTDAMFDGVVEPSEQAYEDTILQDPSNLDLGHVTVRKYEESSYLSGDDDGHTDNDDSTPNQSNSVFVTTNWEVCYKGEPIWRVEMHSHHHAQRSSLCSLLSNGRIGIFVNDHEKSKRNKTFLDIKSLIVASAMAYQLDEGEDGDVAEDMIDVQYDILKKGDVGEEEDVLAIIVKKVEPAIHPSQAFESDEEEDEDARDDANYADDADDDGNDEAEEEEELARILDGEDCEEDVREGVESPGSNIDAIPSYDSMISYQDSEQSPIYATKPSYESKQKKQRQPQRPGSVAELSSTSTELFTDPYNLFLYLTFGCTERL